MDSHSWDQSALRHISRPVHNRSEEENSEGKERKIYMNEEEMNKRDVMVVDDCILHVSQIQKSREQCIDEQQERILLEEMHQDEQLKELGLYEEGMNREQKRQLLEVVAASRETAREEENRRQKSEYWENQSMFEGEGKKENYDKLNYHFDDNGNHHSNSSVSLIERNSPSKEHHESLQLSKSQTASSLSDLDEDTQPLCSQELFHTPFHDEIDTNKENQKIVPENPMSNEGDYSNSCFPTIHHIKGTSNKVLDDTQCTSCQASVQNSTQEQLHVWPSPDSPVSVSLVCPRFLPHMVEKVPFFCPNGMDPKDYTSRIVQSINQYHTQLCKYQRNSLNRCNWADPVVVGRHHPNSLDVAQRRVPIKHENDNDNTLMMRKMVAEHCIETTIDDDSYSLPDLEDWTSESAPTVQTNTKERLYCQKHISLSACADRNAKDFDLSNHCLNSPKENFASKSVVKNALLHIIENEDYSIPANKETEDCIMECENSNSHSVSLVMCDKKVSTEDHMPISHNKQLDCTLIKTDLTSLVLTETILSTQTENIRISDSNAKKTEQIIEKKGDEEVKVNHVLCSSLKDNSESVQGPKISESNIQIECLPSKRDKKAYTRGNQQKVRTGKTVREERQRKRKFDELNLIHESVRCQTNDTFSPVKRKS
ncbi:uncharacterized protein [Centruroides vittatus]|uniref:uncharacterized protein isoform X2 n=1 Tax=Centruroides vittatus TaxID=120091 RepID=UPI0035109E28